MDSDSPSSSSTSMGNESAASAGETFSKRLHSAGWFANSISWTIAPSEEGYSNTLRGQQVGIARRILSWLSFAARDYDFFVIVGKLEVVDYLPLPSNRL